MRLPLGREKAVREAQGEFGFAKLDVVLAAGTGAARDVAMREHHGGACGQAFARPGHDGVLAGPGRPGNPEELWR